MRSRLERLQQELGVQGFEAVVLNAGPSLTYVTGHAFHGMERPVVGVFAAGRDPVLILPELELGKLTATTTTFTTYGYGENPADWGKVFAAAMADLQLAGGAIGMEPRRLRLLEYGLLRPALPADLTDGTELIAALRARKDEDELAAMKRAVTIAEQALAATLPRVRPGVSEQEIAAELFLQLIHHGSLPQLPFMPIVASGPNSANPHAEPTERRLQVGDLLLIDWGANWQGYFSDLTRTFGIVDLDDTPRTIHRLVCEANLAGRQAGGIGVACGEVDRAARGVIERGGYGDFFFHRTGHGLGLECHEEPFIHGANQQLLEVGMTYTVEPGIYLEGCCGVRIEDDMVVTEDGAESLSTLERELRIIG